MQRSRLVGRGWVCVFFLCGISQAQVTTGTILGTVSDSTGAVLPGATITIRNVETGISRVATTDGAGRYRAPQLALGDYELTAASAGFQTAVRGGITITVGREAVVDFSLPVGAIAERVTVIGEAPLVETTNATVSNLVNERAMRELPLNGRSFADLTAIQPGVVSVGQVTPGVFAGGPRFAINGARPQQSLYLLDGLDIVAPYSNVTPSSVMNQLLGVDTIREFSVLRSNYGAQYGRAVGGVVNAVTRSGTNEVHGSAFEFLRNAKLDAKNFFDRPDEKIPTFKRNQFGATFGGPIAKDSTFFFLSYEGLRQRLGISDAGFVLTQEARTQGILRDRAGNITSTVPVNPDVIPLLNLILLPNTPTPIGGGLGEFRGSRTEQGREDFGVVRIDRQLGGKDSLFGRFTIDNSDKSLISPMQVPGGLTTVTDGGYRFASIGETRILSANFLNTFSVGFARNNVGEDQTFKREGLDPRLSAVPGDPLMTANLLGISLPGTRNQLGHELNTPMRFTDNTFDVSDNVIYSRGRHSLNLGGNIKRHQMNESVGTWTHGFVFFPGVAALLQGRPSADTSTLPGADVYRGWRQTYGAVYVQDDLRILPNLTFNLGLRWEMVSSPSEVNGKISVLKSPLLDPRLVRAPKLFELDDAFKGFAPRFGFAWTPFNDRKTVLRGSFGVFREIPLEYMYQLVLFSNPFAGRVTLPNPPFPFPLQGVRSAEGGEPLINDFHFQYPYNYQWNFGVERQITETLVVKGSYIGTRGLKLPALSNPNQPIPQKVNGRWFTPADAPVSNPNFTALRYTSNLGDSWYNALELQAEKRFSHGLQFNTSYTLSKNIDTVPIGLKGAEVVSEEAIFVAFNAFDLRADKALSTLDTRHNFVLSYGYELPFGAGKPFGDSLTGIAAKLAGGWQLSGIARARNGLPQTILLTFANSRNRVAPSNDRADLVSGRSNNPVEGTTAGCPGVVAGQKLGGPGLYFDPCSFTVPAPGFFGNVGRNTLIQPTVVTWDFSVLKNNRVGEHHTLEFRAEFFNVLNRPNFGRATSQVITNAAGAVNPAAGKITSTTTTSRQVQFGLKYTF